MQIVLQLDCSISCKIIKDSESYQNEKVKKPGWSGKGELKDVSTQLQSSCAYVQGENFE